MLIEVPMFLFTVDVLVIDRLLTRGFLRATLTRLTSGRWRSGDPGERVTA